MRFTSFQRVSAVLLSLTLCIPAAEALYNVSSWAEDDVAAAWEMGLEPFALHTASATDSITRSEFCSVALNLYETLSGQDADVPETSPFQDCSNRDVLAANALHIVNGRGGSQTGLFEPNAEIQRQDICIILQNVLDIIGIDAPPIEGDAVLKGYPDREAISPYAEDAMTTMVDYAVLSGIPDTKTGEITIDPKGTATREQALIMANRFLKIFEVYASPRVEAASAFNGPLGLWYDFDYSDPPLEETVSSAESDKMTLVYGPGGSKYQTEEEAESHMTEIAVKVWRLHEDGSKTTGTAYITVNRNLASVYRAVFDEIYNGAERFPIKDAGSYSWRSGEHSQGTAIDINWVENMEAAINDDGTLTPTTGDHWLPGIDPYSIPANGDVVKAFTTHGFIWGGTWHTKKDYMHFSYFGR